MTPEERSFLERARVGSLATADGDGRPHAVPICFALVDESDAGEGGDEPGDGDGRRIVSAIDEKPKSTQDLQRVRDVRENPTVTLLVDRYREDWSRLAWVQVRGRARVLSSSSSVSSDDGDSDERGSGDDDRARESAHERAVTALRSKYDQYDEHALEERPILEIRVGRTLSWGAVGERDGDGRDRESDERGT